MRIGRKKAQTAAPADPNLQVQSDGTAAVATKRGIRLPGVSMPDLSIVMYVLIGLFVALIVAMIVVIVMGGSTDMVTKLIYAIFGDGGAIFAVAIIGGASGRL